MGRVEPKKVAAVMAAVLQHLAETEAAVLSAVPAPTVSCASQALPPLWGWSGRQSSMLDRVTWQRRISKSW